MRKRTKEDKLVDQLEEILNDHHFHPSLIANMMITTYPPYTQQKLMELIQYISRYNEDEKHLDKLMKSARK